MSGETKSKTSTTSSTAEKERKERIIKLKIKINNDAEIIKQIKYDISNMDDNDLKKSLNSTKVALEKEKKEDEATIKNMSLTPLQQRHAEVQKARKEAGVSSDASLLTFAKHLYPQKKAEEETDANKVAAVTGDLTQVRTRKWFGGKRKTKRKIRTRRKKRTKRRRTRRRRSKKRRTRRRRKRRGGTLVATQPTKMM